MNGFLPRLAAEVIVVVVALLVGFAFGIHWAHAGRARADAKAADAAVSTIAAKVQAQNADFTKQLAHQADVTAALDAQQNTIRGQSAAVQTEIEHVVFLDAPGVSCPDPVRSDAFVRLYNAAAAGGDGPAAAASAGTR